MSFIWKGCFFDVPKTLLLLFIRTASLAFWLSGLLIRPVLTHHAFLFSASTPMASPASLSQSPLRKSGGLKPSPGQHQIDQQEPQSLSFSCSGLPARPVFHFIPLPRPPFRHCHNLTKQAKRAISHIQKSGFQTAECGILRLP